MIWNLIFINILICSWSYSNTSEENIYFDVVHNTKVIGSLKATKIIKNSQTIYKSSTTIKTRIIKDICVNYKYNVIFKDAFLETSNVHITINDKSHTKTLTEWKDAKYQIIKNEKKRKTFKDSISYSTVQLYFNEPINIKSCYSEQDGSFNTIVAMGNYTYKKVNSKGKENMYFYKKGILKKAIIDGGAIKFKIIARNTN
ncbi:DUF6134 family protein [Lutibacter citreus]|uniref:DUF6134 family protein n=1 Tax=Lutibacter citreus TaxID=2138210 RepID=UPI000DBEA7FF|nr:DUF6134 family protein [Lutibacter citreus]